MILLALGANLQSRFGTPYQTLRHVLALLPGRGVRVLQVSQFYSNPAVPASHQPDFINCVASVATTVEPLDLIAICLGIEREIGRVRADKWEARPIDMDIIDFDGRKMSAEALTLPHPRLHERAFVLVPLLEIAPAWRHPVTLLTASELLESIPSTAKAALKPLAPQ